jgi:glycerophosphoryl diester phosphodiesterase
LRIWNTLSGAPPRIIAHRGASGYRPENTLSAYRLAIAQGADAIEPDLVASRDRVLFARHDLGLARSTDVAMRPEFAARRRVLAGIEDWWISDFTAAEIDRLAARQPDARRGVAHEGHDTVPRFAELLELAREEAWCRGQTLSIEAEIKQPEHFTALGIDLVAALRDTLQPRDLLGADSPVWLESFDHRFLRNAVAHLGNPAVALLDRFPENRAAWDTQLRNFAGWARAIAPAKHLLWDSMARTSGLVAAAHDYGLEVHAWTFRSDQPSAPFTTPDAELEAAFALGVDALFCDFPDLAVAARTRFAVVG